MQKWECETYIRDIQNSSVKKNNNPMAKTTLFIKCYLQNQNLRNLNSTKNKLKYQGIKAG